MHYIHNVHAYRPRPIDNKDEMGSLGLPVEIINKNVWMKGGLWRHPGHPAICPVIRPSVQPSVYLQFSFSEHILDHNCGDVQGWSGDYGGRMASKTCCNDVSSCDPVS